MPVRTGLDVMLSQAALPLRGKTIGVVCNQAATGPGFDHIVDLLAARRDLRIGAIFGPEHGVRGEAQDMIPVDGDERGAPRDAKLDVPVYSLYGDSFDSLVPTPAMLQGLDALVFDLQDVGSRYYTFAATMVLCMRAAKQAGLEFIVLDRPNPLGGEIVEGGPVEEGFASFVGLIPLPVRHGLTMGEIARYADAKMGIDCELTIVKMDGWDRRMQWEDTGLPFIPPSPNMPTADTARVYPGMCLVEGTNLSEGRGTTRPFELSGAPFCDADELATRLNRQGLPGVRFRAVRFRPTFHKFAHQDCGGVFLHVTDREAFRPYQTGLAFLRFAHDLAPGRFRWRTERYEFVDTVPAIDLLTGSSRFRLALDSGSSLRTLLEEWEAYEDRFLDEREEFLLYA